MNLRILILELGWFGIKVLIFLVGDTLRVSRGGVKREKILLGYRGEAWRGKRYFAGIVGRLGEKKDTLRVSQGGVERKKILCRYRKAS